MDRNAGYGGVPGDSACRPYSPELPHTNPELLVEYPAAFNQRTGGGGRGAEGRVEKTAHQPCFRNWSVAALVYR
jgi:hypothetical protein